MRPTNKHDPPHRNISENHATTKYPSDALYPRDPLQGTTPQTPKCQLRLQNKGVLQIHLETRKIQLQCRLLAVAEQPLPLRGNPKRRFFGGA